MTATDQAHQLSDVVRARIANTIIGQMGGFGRLSAMVKMRHPVALESGVQFKFSGSRKVNTCRVTLGSGDLYTFELWKCTPTMMKQVYLGTGYYADMLITAFETETGLALSL